MRLEISPLGLSGHVILFSAMKETSPHHLSPVSHPCLPPTKHRRDSSIEEKGEGEKEGRRKGRKEKKRWKKEGKQKEEWERETTPQVPHISYKASH